MTSCHTYEVYYDIMSYHANWHRFVMCFMGAFAWKKIIGGFMLYAWKYIDNVLSDAFDSIERDAHSRWKRDDEFGGWKLSILLAGVKKEDVEVTMMNGFARVKHPNGSFRIPLPKDSAHDTLEAKLDLGILELNIKDSKETGTRVVKIQ
jgi:hypothetical protein